MKSYEEQIEELQNEIKALENQKLVKLEFLAITERNFQKAQDLTLQEKIKLEGYKRENEYYEKLKSDNKSLTENFEEATDKLNTVNTELDTVNDELERVHRANIFKLLLKKW